MATKHHKKKERLQKEACERYQNLSEEEKDKMQKKTREIYQNFSKEKKKEKNINIIVNIIKIFVRNKNKSYLSIEEIII